MDNRLDMQKHDLFLNLFLSLLLSLLLSFHFFIWSVPDLPGQTTGHKDNDQLNENQSDGHTSRTTQILLQRFFHLFATTYWVGCSTRWTRLLRSVTVVFTATRWQYWVSSIVTRSFNSATLERLLDALNDLGRLVRLVAVAQEHVVQLLLDAFADLVLHFTLIFEGKVDAHALQDDQDQNDATVLDNKLTRLL